MFREVFIGQLNLQGQMVKVFVYENKLENNRIIIPKSIRKYKSNLEMFKNLKDPFYSPFNFIFIKSNESKNEVENGTGKILNYNKSPDLIKAKIDMSDNGIIVFSEIFYPNGWYCKVNNEFVEIVEVNGLLRGVMLNKGINEIELLFDPTDLKISQIFSLISFFLIGIGMLYGFIFIKND